MAGRILVAPVSMNVASLAAGGVLPVSTPTAGVDAAGTGGTAFATAWGSNQGIMFPNNGLCWVYYWCGVTAAGAVQILQGFKVEGQLPAPGTFGFSITATSSGFLPPLSPHDWNQQDASAYGGASAPGGTSTLGGVIGTSGQGLTCIDFTTTTTLSVRVYQVSQVSP